MQTELSVERDTLLDTRIEDVCEVRKHPITGQNALYALRPFQTGDVLAEFSPAATHHLPTYLTVQLSDEEHIELSPPVLQYMNHSCEPNCFFDTTSMEVVALRDLHANEELSFFYPSSEWHMTQPFECLCGTPSCLRVIAGADAIKSSVLSKYRLTDFIQSKLSQR